MTNKHSFLFSQLGVGLAAFFSMSAAAQVVVYDNSVNDHLLRYDPGALQVGNEVQLAGSPQYLTRFDFEFYGVNLVGNGSPVSAQVRFYYNTGPLFNGYATPSATPFYDSGIFAVGGPTTRSTLIFTAGSDFPSGGLPISSSDFTWTVQFSNLSVIDSAGLDIYGPPVIGNAFDDIWVNSGGSWILVTNSVNQNVFGARFETPEPSSVALLVLGGLGFMFAGWRSRKQ